MKFRSVTAVALTAGILLASAACSSAGTADSKSGSHTSAPSKNGPSKTYQAGDLPPILTAAKKTLGITGTVLNNVQVQAQKAKLGSGGIAALLDKSGVTISPAACGQLIKNNLAAPADKGIVASTLTSGSNVISVATEADKNLPVGDTNAAIAREQKVLDQCGKITMAIAEGSQTIKAQLAIEKLDVTTNADQTYGFSETVTIPTAAGGHTTAVAVSTVTAISGNLLITVISSSGAGTATPAPLNPSEAINAVIAAAK